MSVSTVVGSYASEPRRPKACAEVERLAAHDEEREENIVLGDVAAEAAQGHSVDRGAIDAEVSRRGGAGLKAAGEDLEQRRLAGAARSDDGKQLARARARQLSCGALGATGCCGSPAEVRAQHGCRWRRGGGRRACSIS